MRGLVYPIIWTPNSNHLSILSLALDEENENSVFVSPKQNSESKVPTLIWTWEDKKFNFKIPENQEINEYFLLFSNKILISDQIEALLLLLQENGDLKLGRIIAFVDCDCLATEKISDWMDGVAHFSDVICFVNRSNSNGVFVKSFTEKFRSQHFPMEIYVLGSKKDPPICRILSPVSRRITHIFEPDDLLEDQDTPEHDPFLKKSPNGQRLREVPCIFS